MNLQGMTNLSPALIRVRKLGKKPHAYFKVSYTFFFFLDIKFTRTPEKFLTHLFSNDCVSYLISTVH